MEAVEQFWISLTSPGAQEHPLSWHFTPTTPVPQTWDSHLWPWGPPWAAVQETQSTPTWALDWRCHGQCGHIHCSHCCGPHWGCGEGLWSHPYNTNSPEINPHEPQSLQCSHLPRMWCVGGPGPQALASSGAEWPSRFPPAHGWRMCNPQGWRICSLYGGLDFLLITQAIWSQIWWVRQMRLRDTSKVWWTKVTQRLVSLHLMLRSCCMGLRSHGQGQSWQLGVF